MVLVRFMNCIYKILQVIVYTKPWKQSAHPPELGQRVGAYYAHDARKMS